MITFDEIASGTSEVAVVGLGYVGLPLAVALSDHFKVIGFDISRHRIQELRSGQDSTREVEPDRLNRARIEYTDDPAQLARAGIIVVAVPTPIDGNRKPDLRPVVGATATVVRARRTRYIPVVLSREEVARILSEMSAPHLLVVQLLYGCGLRMSECLNLRVHCFNFDDAVLTIHDGKGKKDRTVPLPKSLIPELKAHMEKVVNLHEKDLAAGYAGVFMPGALDRKWKSAAREFIWQWFFPARTLTLIPEENERRRYHMHESELQKALRAAARKARIPKRVTCHTFRHTFASHLLAANYDVRTIQQMLGHSDIRTTMIYTHTIPSRTLKEQVSPLDFPA